MTDYRKIGFWQLVLLAVLLNFVSQTIHEGGHWLVHQIAGRGPVWGFISLVQVWGDPPLHPEDWIETTSPDGEQGWLRMASAPTKTEDIIALAAGPLAGLLGVVLGLSQVFSKRSPAVKQMGLVLALIGSLLMSQYYLRGANRMGGDEYFLAAHLGISKAALDIPLGLAFITSFVVGVWALGDWRTRLKWLGAVLLGSIPVGIFLMNADSLIRAQVNLENPLFQPLLGFSLPVIVVNALALLGLWLWWKRQARNDVEKISATKA